MAKKKSQHRNIIPPGMPQATPAEMQALFKELGVPVGDPAAMALLAKLAQQSGMKIGELFEAILPGVTDLVEPPQRGKAASKSQPAKRSRRKTSKPDVDNLLEAALSAGSPAKKIELLENVVAVAKDQLGSTFEKSVGHFWGIAKTRPYMTASLELAEAYLEVGEHEKAIVRMEEMLTLNPNDNQGVRWLLLEWYCNMNWVEKAWGLLEKYQDDASPFMAMTHVCLEFQKTGPTEQLKSRLQEIIEFNPDLVPTLLSPESVEPRFDEAFESGSLEEATSYCRRFRSLWKATPGALPWLSSVAPEMMPEEPEFTLDEIKQTVQDVLNDASSRPSKKREIWYCDIEVLDDDSNHVDGEVDWSENEGSPNWLMTLINVDDSDAIRIGPGGFPLSLESVLFELGMAMTEPEIGDPRRPGIVQFNDSTLASRIKDRLKPIRVTVEAVDEMPGIIQFLRRQRLNPAAGPFPLNQILELPAGEEEVWEMDWRPIDAWVPDPETQEPIQPWVILVGAPDQGFILAQQVSHVLPTTDMLGTVLAEAILNPMQSEPARPSRLVVRQLSHRLELLSIADSIGCEIAVAECEMLEQVHRSMQSQEAGNGPKLAALIQQPGMTPEIIGDFFAASAAYFESRIYTRTRPETIVEVSCPEILPGKRTCVTMGQMGQEIGIMIFDNPRIVKALFQSRHDRPEDAMTTMTGIGYSVDTRDRLHPADVAASERFGWPVPSPETWPSIYHISEGKLRTVTAAELQFTTIAIHATLQTLTASKPALELTIRLHDQTVKVKTKKSTV